MTRSRNKLEVYLEVGNKRVFAGALDWPGWARSGQDEASALQALLDYGQRYAHVLRRSRLGFHPPEDVAAFVIKERLKGNATTDFGAPGIAPSFDQKQVSAQELQRLKSILRACWRALDQAMEAASGKSLRSGPRGGGRLREGIREHVLDAEMGYLKQLGWKLLPEDAGDMERRRQEILRGLDASVRGEIPTRGPRGGLRWSPRYFVRRAAWHLLDHAWEIEDRITE